MKITMMLTVDLDPGVVPAQALRIIKKVVEAGIKGRYLPMELADLNFELDPGISVEDETLFIQEFISRKKETGDLTVENLISTMTNYLPFDGTFTYDEQEYLGIQILRQAVGLLDEDARNFAIEFRAEDRRQREVQLGDDRSNEAIAFINESGSTVARFERWLNEGGNDAKV